eukprot:CAMPEP_0196658776 /NCGR_PEP_ID=MMETSP1086-20130531/31466_1 /TAXON_ID=77921 /ORGANISM="Cyanoptyche  gloeocystis , Strain SAG4.97" /LENGTH=133 /DNA_ID=CAMNT_0041992505 /DNA_START=305 /DNA_END=706 /DNA_ORIENTATION=-
MRLKLGKRPLDPTRFPVSGLTFDTLNHSSIAQRSYECPSCATTGSVMRWPVIEHRNWGGVRRCSSPSPRRSMACGCGSVPYFVMTTCTAAQLEHATSAISALALSASVPSKRFSNRNEQHIISATPTREPTPP